MLRLLYTMHYQLLFDTAKLLEAATFLNILSPFDTLPNFILIVETSLACECLVEARLKIIVAQRILPTKIQELWNNLLSIISSLGLPVL